MQAQWGCLIRMEECLQHALLGLILWEHSRFWEQPRAESCLTAPPSVVPQQTGKGSRAVFLLGSSTVPRRKNRRKCFLSDTACLVVLGRVWKTELSNEISMQSIHPTAVLCASLPLKSRCQLPAQKSIFSFWKYQNGKSKCPKSETT